MHEHPAQATSWALTAVEKLADKEDVMLTLADQCQYGLKTPGKYEHPTPAKKPTKFLTNSVWIAQELSRKCPGHHSHQHLVGGRAKATGRYPPKLCDAICRGLVQELHCSTLGIKGVAEILPLSSVSLTQKADVDHDEDEKG